VVETCSSLWAVEGHWGPFFPNWPSNWGTQSYSGSLLPTSQSNPSTPLNGPCKKGPAHSHSPPQGNEMSPRPPLLMFIWAGRGRAIYQRFFKNCQLVNLSFHHFAESWQKKVRYQVSLVTGKRLRASENFGRSASWLVLYKVLWSRDCVLPHSQEPFW